MIFAENMMAGSLGGVVTALLVGAVVGIFMKRWVLRLHSEIDDLERRLLSHKFAGQMSENDGELPQTALLDLPDALVECIARALGLLELGRFARSSVVCRAAATAALPEVVASEVARRLEAHMQIDNALCAACPHLVVPHGPAKVGWVAFWKSISLMSIELPLSITSIGNDAFKLCTSLTSITLPASLTEIGAGTFKSCTALTTITLPPLVTKIRMSTFYGCTALTIVTLPAAVCEIEPLAFYGCRSLTAIALPASLTARVATAEDKSISDCAFLGCVALDEPSRTALRTGHIWAIDEDVWQPHA
jgi:hypothetical protein